MGSAATGPLESRARSSCSCLLSQGIVRLVLASWEWRWVPDLLSAQLNGVWAETDLLQVSMGGYVLHTDRFKFPKWHLVGWCHHSRKSSSKLVLLNGYFQYSLFNWESQLPSAYPGGSPRWSDGSDPCLFQISACVLGLRVCDILYARLKSEDSVSYSLPAFPNRKLAGYQARFSEGLSSLCRPSFTQKPNVGMLNSCVFIGKDVYIWYSFHLWVAHPEVSVLTIMYLCLSYPPHCCSCFRSLDLKIFSDSP